MMNQTRLLLVIVFAFGSVIFSSALANVESNRNSIIKAPEFNVTTETKIIKFPGDTDATATRLTDVRMILRTDSPSEIEKYAVVQWIKGCQFNSSLQKDGSVTKTLDLSRYHFGKVVTFKHIDWQIDSDILDPVYSADADFGRYALLRWNKDPNSLDPETATYYARAKPPHGSVFLTDLPGSAFANFDKNLGRWQAQNTSLEFKTCLYNATDIPKISDPHGTNFTSVKPLACLNWEHKFVFNFAVGQFEIGGEIDPICR